MTDEQRAVLNGRKVALKQKELSELREAYNKEEDAEKRAEMEAKLTAGEVELRANIDEWMKAQDDLKDTPDLADSERAVREFDELYHRASLNNYIAAFESNKEPEGAELELRQALMPEGGRFPNTFPLAMLLDEREQRLQVRQDTATTVNAVTGMRTTMPIAQAVFGNSQAGYMGARFIAVSGGQQDFPFIASSTDATAKDENEEIDAIAGNIQVVSSNPREVGASYLWGLTTQLRYAPGQLEAALRADARSVIDDYIGRTVIQGQVAVNADNVPAIEGLITVPLTGGAPTVDVDAQTFMELAASHVDAIWADQDDDVRYLVSAMTWRKIAYLRLHEQADQFVKDMLRGRLRASHYIEDGTPASGKRDQNVLTYSPSNDTGELIIPTWQDVMVTFDQVTRANRRQRRLSLDTAYDVIRRRSNPWRRQQVQIAV